MGRDYGAERVVCMQLRPADPHTLPGRGLHHPATSLSKAFTLSILVMRELHPGLPSTYTKPTLGSYPGVGSFVGGGICPLLEDHFKGST